MGWGGWRGNPGGPSSTSFRESVVEPTRAGDLTYPRTKIEYSNIRFSFVEFTVARQCRISTGFAADWSMMLFVLYARRPLASMTGFLRAHTKEQIKPQCQRRARDWPPAQTGSGQTSAQNNKAAQELF